MSKYRAIPTVVNGIRFASKKEAGRYSELMLLFKAGKIRQLYLQPEYPCHVMGHEIPIGVYRADFSYLEGDKHIVEDVKGVKTPLYRWKKKHVEAQYGIKIRET